MCFIRITYTKQGVFDPLRNQTASTSTSSTLVGSSNHVPQSAQHRLEITLPRVPPDYEVQRLLVHRVPILLV